VLKIHVVRPGGHLYYVDGLVPGRAEGTGVAGEAPGVWTGSGAGGLGVSGTVEVREFGEVLGGHDPGSGQALRMQKGARSVSGYDLAFCAPKSVSLLHLLAPGEIAAEVGAGHRAAVAEAAGYLQRVALGVRRSHGGQVARLTTTGAVAGEFVHRTSRALDPHLHTHLVLANVAQGLDGRWSAVDGRRIFAHHRALRGLYHARLRLELSSRLGAGWDVPANGMGDVRGVDRRLRVIFSQRSAAIAEYAARRPGRNAGARPTRGAFYATRPEKDRTRTVESLTAEWKERAADFGFDLGDLTTVVGLGGTRDRGPVIDPDRVRTQLGALAPHRTLARHDVVALLAGASTGGASAQVIESAASQVVAAIDAPTSRSDGAGHTVADGHPRVGPPGMVGPRWAVADVVRGVARSGELGWASSGDLSVAGHGRRPSGERRLESDPDLTRTRASEVARARSDHELGR
jgi:conjugative relaxase-like TrwC/TraI family protein